jgi:hypothetical protein
MSVECVSGTKKTAGESLNRQVSGIRSGFITLLWIQIVTECSLAAFLTCSRMMRSNSPSNVPSRTDTTGGHCGSSRRKGAGIMKGRKGELAAVAAVIVIAMGLLVTPASADHNFTFTQANTTFDATDSNGRFTGRAVTNPGQAVPMAWSFRISPQVQAIATSAMDCTAGHMQLNYHDGHPGVPVDYVWHSTVPGNQSNNTQYTLYGSCSFRVVNNGNANLRFSFHYSMFCGPCGLPRSDPGRNELSTSFEIKYAA